MTCRPCRTVCKGVKPATIKWPAGLNFVKQYVKGLDKKLSSILQEMCRTVCKAVATQNYEDNTHHVICRKCIAVWVQAMQQMPYSCVAVQTSSVTLQPTGTWRPPSCHSWPPGGNTGLPARQMPALPMICTWTFWPGGSLTIDLRWHLTSIERPRSYCRETMIIINKNQKSNSNILLITLGFVFLENWMKFNGLEYLEIRNIVGCIPSVRYTQLYYYLARWVR